MKALETSDTPVKARCDEAAAIGAHLTGGHQVRGLLIAKQHNKISAVNVAPALLRANQASDWIARKCA